MLKIKINDEKIPSIMMSSAILLGILTVLIKSAIILYCIIGITLLMNIILFALGLIHIFSK